MKYTGIRRLAGLMTVVVLCLATPYAAADDKKKEKLPDGEPVLWKDPGDVTSRNLYWGIGREQDAPKPPFTFVEEVTSGTNPKVRVKDAAGVEWSVKFDEEVHAEIAATRIAWALGYMVEETYFVPSGRIEGVTNLGRAKEFVSSDGAFSTARFEKRPTDVERRGVEWAWDQNPFVGSKELSGLLILNSLLSNWDTKESNNEILAVRSGNAQIEDWYIISDWGGSFGKMGGVFSRSKWDLEDYQKQEFIKEVKDGRLELNFKGAHSSVHKSVPLEHARWFADLAGQLTDEQLQDAFRAAGASAQEGAAFARRLRERIEQLTSTVQSGSVPIAREQ